jgi:hypothetical protein
MAKNILIYEQASKQAIHIVASEEIIDVCLKMDKQQILHDDRPRSFTYLLKTDQLAKGNYQLEVKTKSMKNTRFFEIK